jgi:hypothetical protein
LADVRVETSMFRFALSALLLLTLTPAAAEKLTIRCDVNGAHNLLTFDTATNRMISDAIGGSTHEEGQIKSTNDREIEFELRRPDQEQARYHYMREEGRIYFQNNFERLVAAERCVPAPLRRGPT